MSVDHQMIPLLMFVQVEKRGDTISRRLSIRKLTSRKTKVFCFLALIFVLTNGKIIYND